MNKAHPLANHSFPPSGLDRSLYVFCRKTILLDSKHTDPTDNSASQDNFTIVEYH